MNHQTGWCRHTEKERYIKCGTFFGGGFLGDGRLEEAGVLWDYLETREEVVSAWDS